MKRKLMMMIMTTLVSTSGCAQLTPNEVAGAVAGGIIGNQIGGGSGKVAATAAGAVIGANIGRQVEPQPFPTQSRGYPPGTRPPYAYGSDGTYPIYERNGICDHETHIDGVYNPPAAQRYCQGKVERERRAQQRYEQEVYRRGLEGR